MLVALNLIFCPLEESENSLVKSSPTYATDILSNLWNGQNKTAISSYVWEDTLDSGLSYVAGSLQVNVGGEDFTSEFSLLIHELPL